MNRKNAKLFLIPAILFAVFFVFGNEAKAATNWYVSPTGSANCASGCLTGAPCSLATVLTCNVVGDNNVILKDGTYTGTSLNVPWSGTSGHPITIKAENDGQAVVDGQGVLQPLLISSKIYITIEGIIFKNSSQDVGKVSGSSANIQIKKCGFIEAGNDNYHLLIIQYYSHDVLVEDSFMTQVANGRQGINVFGGAHHVTLRRNYIRYVKHEGGGGPCNLISIYGANHVLLENNFLDARNMPSDCDDERKFIGGPARYGATDYVVFKGNIMLGNSNTNFADVHGASAGECQYATGYWEYYNNVYMTTVRGVFADDSPNDIYQNNNYIDLTKGANEIALLARTIGCRSTTATVGSNSFLNVDYALGTQSGTTITANYNNYYDIGVAQTYGSGVTNSNPKTITPNYNTSTYGNGAYLMVPPALKGKGENGADIGAEVLYRYQDGVLTNQPLWPWPMEDRIKAETSHSVTWEANGGLWKTLDGVYSQPTDTTPPAAPSGLQVQ